MLEPFVCDEMN